MSDLPHLRAGRKRSFVVGHYNQQGELLDVPAHLPCGCGDGACRVERHGSRPRSTGPGHRLVLLRCVEHGRCFTVYPPGFVPFARQPLICDPCEREGSLFDAAFDAAEGHRWPGAQGDPSFHTQRRHLHRLALWLALRAPLAIAEQVPSLLRISLDDWLTLRGQWRMARSYRACGQVIKQLCEIVTPIPLRILFALAARCGACGQAFEILSDRRLVPLWGSPAHLPNGFGILVTRSRLYTATLSPIHVLEAP